METILDVIREAPVEDLKRLRYEASQLIDKRISEAVREVQSEKIGASIWLTYNGKSIILKNEAFRGRYRIYGTKIGKSGRLIKGEVLNRESCSNVREIKEAFRFGKDPSRIF